MSEMLPEERQIVKAPNPWLSLSSPSFYDRKRQRSLYIKVCRETTAIGKNIPTILYVMLSELFKVIYCTTYVSLVHSLDSFLHCVMTGALVISIDCRDTHANLKRR